MEKEYTDIKPRSRVEIAAWLRRARQRKLEWETNTQKWLEERAEKRRQAKDSHYYDIEMA